MTRAFLYIVGGSKSPDYVDCAVPWRVDKDEIFFGPCMKRLREGPLKALKDKFKSGQDVPPTYIIGLSPSNTNKVRRVLWAGRIKPPMTFEVAYNQLNEDRYQQMRCHPQSPLHVKPIYDQDRFVGYERLNKLHGDRGWRSDLAAPGTLEDASLIEPDEDGKRLRLKPGIERHKAFRRDLCALCDNLFFAGHGGHKEGLKVNDGLVKILQGAQPGKDVDRYAVFGYQGTEQRRRPNGKRGGYLPLDGNYADEVIEWICRGASSTTMDR